MENIINLLVGELSLAPEYQFVAACIALCLVVDVLTGVLSAIVPLMRSVR